MADFVQTNVNKTAVRDLAVPIADVTSFDSLVETVIGLSKAKRPARVPPLPGILDFREFSRMKVDLGRCDICGTGKAVYHSREAQTGICEGCYSRLVREENAREGVRR